MTPEDRMKSLGSVDGSTPSEAEWLEFRTKAHRSVARRRIAAAAGGAALLLAVVGGAYAMSNGPTDDQRGPGIAAPGATESGSPSPDTSPSSDPDPDEVEYVHLQQWYVENDKLALFHAQVEKTETPAREAIENLIAAVPGPLAEEGVETYIPEGTTLADVTIENGTASVTFSGDFPDDSAEQQRFAYAQIVYTLTQFPTVKDVSLSWESAESGGVAGAPEDRKAYEDLLPPIVVEAPYAGEVVDRTFTMSGIANVFEANVSWRIVDDEDNVIDEGFTTATCGTGCWGTFEEEIRYTGIENWAVLQVFQSSAEDGSPMDMVQIPLNFEKSKG